MNSQTELDPSRYGSVSKLDDGRAMVRFERHLPYKIERVWSAITEPAELERWFPGLTFEPRTGGTYEIWFGGDCDGPAHVSGAVVAYPHDCLHQHDLDERLLRLMRILSR